MTKGSLTLHIHTLPFNVKTSLQKALFIQFSAALVGKSCKPYGRLETIYRHFHLNVPTA
jgi:hypothetical protein